MLDNKGFYPIWEKIDRTLLEARDYIEARQVLPGYPVSPAGIKE
jgi:hypothetical protein